MLTQLLASQDNVLTFVTDFADQAVVLPVIAAVALAFALERRWRLLRSWLLAITGVLGALAVLKVFGYACGWLWPPLVSGDLSIRSPSGHTGSAAAVSGALGGLIASRTRAISPEPVLISAIAAGVLIGATRLLLHVHTPGEVGLALSIGVCGAFAFAWMAGPEAAARPAWLAAGVALTAAAVMHGHHLGAESALQAEWAQRLRVVLTACAVS